MNIFHTHNFKEKDNSLWCACGKIKTFPCAHKWTIHNEKNIDILNQITGKRAHQSVQTLICSSCGEIKYINLTIGKHEKL